MPAESAIRVEGLRELDRAFEAANRAQQKDLRDSLRRGAEPVRTDAERRAASEITNIDEGDPWQRMRVGVTRTAVYVAPRRRGVKARGDQAKRRPNLADRLMDDAMQPALDENRDEVEREVENVLERMEDVWGRAR